MFAEFGEQNEGVVGAAFSWDTLWEGGKTDYSFSLRNRLQQPVRAVRCLVIFYDNAGEPLDAHPSECKEIIPAGLAKRVKKQYVDSSLRTLTSRYQKEGRIEIRVLDYQLAE